MKRDDFKKIIKLRSIWKIDRRKGNYTLPNGEKLTIYVKNLVESQMKVDIKQAHTAKGRGLLVFIQVLLLSDPHGFLWIPVPNPTDFEIVA